MKTVLCLSLASLLILGTRADAQQAVPLPMEERLEQVEQHLVRLLDEVRAIRKGMKSSGSTRGASADPAAQPEMQQGCRARVYVRTGGANINSPPAPKAAPSDERVEAGSQFNPMQQSQAAGYHYQTTAATIVWEGFFLVEESGVYEFLYDTGYGAAQVGPKVLSAMGEKSVRLDLTPGYWPIKVYCGNNAGEGLSLRVKRSGLDPVQLTPGSLWTPKDTP